MLNKYILSYPCLMRKFAKNLCVNRRSLFSTNILNMNKAIYKIILNLYSGQIDRYFRKVIGYLYLSYFLLFLKNNVLSNQDFCLFFQNWNIYHLYSASILQQTLYK